jgi:diaminopimelate decarboxylase
VGVHVHIGSQITSVEPLRRAAQTVATLALELRDDGVALEHVDIGGGLGISYDQEQAIGVAEYAAVVIPELQRCGIPVVLEPGRVIVGRAGAMVATVVDIKRFGVDRQFAVLDAGMAELLRPALYGAYHRIVPLRRRTGAETPWDVVGPICESSDVFAQERPLPPLEVRDRVALLDAGAYGSAMASNYNRHQLPPEVLVDGDRWTVIRRRQSIDDMLALES